jgi:hypothetical protein
MIEGAVMAQNRGSEVDASSRVEWFSPAAAPHGPITIADATTDNKVHAQLILRHTIQ